jgi:hypothetical protein
MRFGYQPNKEKQETLILKTSIFSKGKKDASADTSEGSTPIRRGSTKALEGVGGGY